MQSNNRNAMDHELRAKDQVTGSPICVDFIQRYEAAYARELDHFIDILEGGRSVCICNPISRRNWQQL